jgi:hypothetical protein
LIIKKTIIELWNVIMCYELDLFKIMLWGRDGMVVGFTTTCAKSVPITTKVVSLNPAVLDTTLCDKVCQ